MGMRADSVMVKRFVAAMTASMVGVGLMTGTASAAVPMAKKPVPKVVSLPSDNVRIDKQDEPSVVQVDGVARGVKVTVSWGDSVRDSASGKCVEAKAKKNPGACSVTFDHTFMNPGTYALTVRSSGRTLAERAVTVLPEPTPWRPPAEWVQPAGWEVLNGGATFLPCSTVTWFWDRAGEPADRTGLHDVTVEALSRLSAETGLTFVEVGTADEAQLLYKWSDLSEFPYAQGAAGVGGGRPNSQTGKVEFSTTNWWTANEWNGFDVVTVGNSYANGNGWLVMHETMHVLGLGHVNDAAQVMNPVTTMTTFGSGDLDGLHTMYLNQPCPV